MNLEKFKIIRDKKDNKNLKTFLNMNWNRLQKKYKKKGLLLFRCFEVNDLKDFNQAIKSIHKKVVNYTEGSTPRSKVKGKIYTSTEISSKRQIPLHNEMSYTSQYPKNLWFYAHKVSAKGGYTTVADSSKIYNQIPKKFKDKFEKKKVMYIRKYGVGFDLSWQKTFNTESKKKVEEYCKKRKIKFSWIEKNKLITWQVHRFSIYNKFMNKRVWFNQAHLFHNSNIDKKTKILLKKIFKKDFYSRDSKFGDGSDIPKDYFFQMNRILEKNSLNIKWKKNDILLINNLAISHGRRKYSGDRKVYVAMTNDVA